MTVAVAFALVVAIFQRQVFTLLSKSKRRESPSQSWSPSLSLRPQGQDRKNCISKLKVCVRSYCQAPFRLESSLVTHQTRESERDSKCQTERATVKDRQKVRQTDVAEIAKGKSPQCQLFLLPSRAYIKCVACIWKTVGWDRIYIWGNILFRIWCGISRMSHNKNYARMWLTMCTKDKTESATQNGCSSKKHSLLLVTIII